MKELLAALQTNMQHAYRKSVDADTTLNELQKSGKGKFTAIFGDESPFRTRNKRFMPYLEEIADDIEQLQQSPDLAESLLPAIVKRLELLLATLSKFKGSLTND